MINLKVMKIKDFILSRFFLSRFFNLYFFQEKLTRSVSTSLVGKPDLEDPTNETRAKIVDLCLKVVEHEPEFVLKVGVCMCILNVSSSWHLSLQIAPEKPRFKPVVLRN